MRTEVIQAFDKEIKLSAQAQQQEQWQQAWFHLERAHILGQQHFGRHLNSHWLMLKLAAEQGNRTEIFAQLLRLLLTPIGHLTGRLPQGNPGSGRYPVLQAMPVPQDLENLLPKATDKKP